jgi:PAS domain S-box-containing protein
MNKTLEMLTLMLHNKEKELTFLNSVLINIIGGLSFINTTGQYVTVNKKYSDTCGYDEGELDGQSWRITVKDIDTANLCYLEMMEKGMSEMQFEGIKKDGTIFNKNIILVKSEINGQMNGHYCFMNEIFKP